MEKGRIQKFLSMEISTSLKKNEARNLVITMFLVGDVICRIESTTSLNFVRSSMERPARVLDRLLDILEILEGEDALKLVNLRIVVSGF